MPRSKPSRPKTPLQQFQIVEVRAGREWTLYVLDAEGVMWCRYWAETGYRRGDRYVTGKWGTWRTLDADTLA